VVFALAEVLGLEKFGEADDLSAASGGVGEAFQSFGEIVVGLWAAGHLHQGYAEFIRGQGWVLDDQYSI
jgi:hypothetical protein